MELFKHLEPGKIFQMKDMVDYEEDGISNIEVFSSDQVRLSLLAFDKGQALSPHKAPGDVIVFALEGKATIEYENEPFTITKGENFVFAKNALHAVEAIEKFKMMLVIVKNA